MPLKPLPKKLVERLKRTAPKLTDYRLKKMENIDHRREEIRKAALLEWAPYLPPDNEPGEPGFRVRQMNVSRNFPKEKLVIKSSHAQSGEKVIDYVTNKVKKHNQEYKPGKYALLEPKAYHLGDRLIAMSRADFPSVEEILGSSKMEPTNRGAKFFKELEKKHGITRQQLIDVWEELCQRAEFTSGNVLLAGFKKGKFIFVPLIDKF